ncbi:MAG: adenylate/guanylate cyclase domain-containing protein, partial [Candidatus Hodarchaeales archaeon]
MECPNCKSINPPNSKFCNNCGSNLQQYLKKENEEISSHPLSQYIPKELIPKLNKSDAFSGIEKERRVVTILFCDVKGSTAAAETMDPEEWLDIMNETFKYLITPVYRYEGTVARLMGDAILAFFGAPIAHDDDPVRAIQVGLDILHDIED